jgi:hypothetical protein
MQYKKSNVQGGWVKNSEVVSGSKCKLVSEASPIEGEFGMRDVAKIRFQGETGEARNVNLNKPTVNALIDAFGEDSKSWIGHVLTAHTEKVVVAGRRVTALYLIPEGFELSEDSGGYLVIGRVGKEAGKDVEAATDISPEDIPF